MGIHRCLLDHPLLMTVDTVLKFLLLDTKLWGLVVCVSWQGSWDLLEKWHCTISGHHLQRSKWGWDVLGQAYVWKLFFKWFGLKYKILGIIFKNWEPYFNSRFMQTQHTYIHNYVISIEKQIFTWLKTLD